MYFNLRDYYQCEDTNTTPSFYTKLNTDDITKCSNVLLVTRKGRLLRPKEPAWDQIFSFSRLALRKTYHKEISLLEGTRKETCLDKMCSISRRKCAPRLVCLAVEAFLFLRCTIEIFSQTTINSFPVTFTSNFMYSAPRYKSRSSVDFGRTIALTWDRSPYRYTLNMLIRLVKPNFIMASAIYTPN